MRKTKAAAAALLCSMLAQSAYAGERTQAAVRTAQVIPARLSEPSQPAAIRTLDAKAKGADFAMQDRILDLTFVLCMAGTPLQG